MNEKNLCCMILKQAVDDYTLLLKHKTSRIKSNNQFIHKKEIENFIKSTWGKELMEYVFGYALSLEEFEKRVKENL